ncbi:MAG: glycosyltransferase family 2 protein [Bacteriovoracaceae bacterium]|nr:glycosyltransferase family 2 protein [Bacteriovoracaceae bacterium]
MDYINRKLSSSVDVTFFVPCLNEEGNIGKTLINLIEVSKETQITCEILVFDDYSTDGSMSEVESIKSSYPNANIKIVNNKKRRGLARNYVDGSYVAEGTYYMLVNGDNAEPKESILKIISQKGNADMIIPVFQSTDNRKWGRRNLSLFFTAIINFISSNKIHYFNGPVLHRRFNVMRWHADTDGFGYQAEIIVRLIQEGATYKEVIISNNDRQAGISNALTVANMLAVGHSVVQILLRRIRFYLYYSNKVN